MGKIFRTNYNIIEPAPEEINNGVSKTVPNMSKSIKDMLEMHTTGGEPLIVKKGVFQEQTENFDVDIEFRTDLDLADISELGVTHQILMDKVKEHAAKIKDKAAKAQQEEQAAFKEWQQEQKLLKKETDKKEQISPK